MSTKSRHAAPTFLPTQGDPVLLKRLRLGASDDESGYREAFLQQLVFQHPELIPMHEIEPALVPLVSVCTELPTPAGPVDNLWITPTGNLVLGECKLVRNSQSRREVVAQALDYARGIADWRYENLEMAIRQTSDGRTRTIWERVADLTDLTEDEFVDAVERRLRTGRLLALIIGDGIEEGAESLASYLQMHAGIHAGLALVELSIWKADHGLLIVPRVPMRTVLIERGIVTVDPGGQVRILPPAPIKGATGPQKASTLSEAEFYDRLEQQRPGSASKLKSFLSSLEEIGVSPEYRRAVVIRLHVSADVEISLGYIDVSGRVWLGDAWNAAEKAGLPQVGERYIERIARAMGGSVRRYDKSPPAVLGPGGKVADVMEVLAVAADWRMAILSLRDELSATA